MASADRYRRYASECIRRAQQIHDLAHKSRMLEMAVNWRRLADNAAKIDHRVDEEAKEDRG